MSTHHSLDHSLDRSLGHRPQRSGRISGRVPALLLIGALTLTACGTRASDSEFAAVFGQSGDQTAQPADSSGDTEGGPAASGVPDTSASDDASEITGGQTPGSNDPAPPSGASPTTDAGAGTTDQPTAGTDSGGTNNGGTDNGGSNAGGGPAANEASDVGVTPTSIKVGNIASLSGALGEDAFGPSYFGAFAYFQYLNEALGGVHGRTIEVVPCDDAEDPSQNQACVDRMINDEKIFAFVANATRAYAGAEEVSKAGVPDIMGQPIGNAYWTWPGFYAVRGSEYAQEGEIGYKGQVYGGLVAYDWVKNVLGAESAAVFYYSIPASKQFGQHIADGLRTVGIAVEEIEVNVALPNFDAHVSRMSDVGVDNIWDAMDVNGNRNLCAAMDRNSFSVTAKISTSQGMGRGIGTYSSPCRESIYAVTESIPYSDETNPEVQTFQQVMSTFYSGAYDDRLAQWAWEGWLAAKSFTEAVEQMGPTPTRAGLKAFYDNAEDYTLGGLFSPLEWTTVDFDNEPERTECIIVSKWDEPRSDFTRVSDNPHCTPTTYVKYAPA